MVKVSRGNLITYPPSFFSPSLLFCFLAFCWMFLFELAAGTPTCIRLVGPFLVCIDGLYRIYDAM